jgi:hypothetical protein
MLASDEASHAHHVVTYNGGQMRKLLRTSLLYGANASGKSNLIKAMAFARDFIVNGVDKHKNIDIKPFKLQEDCVSKPARFEFEFYCMGKAYAYGFILEKHRVVGEWLFDLSQVEEISIFERREEQPTGFNYKHPIFDNLSDEGKQRLKFEADGTRDNLLFLTNCQERKIIRFDTIYKWFKETLVIIFPQPKNQFLTTLSSGEKQIISLFSHLYLSGDKQYLILLDEPELSLSVQWQKHLLPDILASKRCMFLATVTHSPFVFDNELDDYAADIRDYIEESK